MSNEILIVKLECCVVNISSELFIILRKYFKGMVDKIVVIEILNKFILFLLENNEGNIKINFVLYKFVVVSIVLLFEENEGDIKINFVLDKFVVDNCGILFVGNFYIMGIDNRRIYIYKKCIIYILDNKNIEGVYYYFKN